MLELAATRVAVVACHATPAAIDALAEADGAYPCRIAPDEMLLIGAPGEAQELASDASGRASSADPDALVLDATDGWAMWTIEGDDVGEAFARLSAISLPAEGFTQGDVGGVPVKVVARPDRLHLLVPSMWREHLRERVLGVGLPVRERAEPGSWSGGGEP